MIIASPRQTARGTRSTIGGPLGRCSLTGVLA
jgi:hypothetical protein